MVACVTSVGTVWSIGLMTRFLVEKKEKSNEGHVVDGVGFLS